MANIKGLRKGMWFKDTAENDIQVLSTAELVNGTDDIVVSVWESPDESKIESFNSDNFDPETLVLKNDNREIVLNLQKPEPVEEEVADEEDIEDEEDLDEDEDEEDEE